MVAEEETSEGRDPLKLALKRKRPWWLRLLRVAGALLLLLVVLVGAVVGYFHTSSGKARVRALIAAKLSEKMNGSAEVGQLDYALGGNLLLGQVTLRDAKGQEVVRLGSLRVVPSWGDLLHGRLVIHEIALDDLKVHVVKDADGGNNLKRMFKLPHLEPLDKPLTIEKLHVEKVDVAIEQPDGTKLDLTNLGLDGSLHVDPTIHKVDVEVTNIGGSVLVDKGNDAVKLRVADLTTGLTAHLENEKGRVTLHPLSGHVALTFPGRDARNFDIALGETSFDLGEGSLDASLGSLLTGVVALGSVQIQGNIGDLNASQKADVVGLHVDAAKVNELLGKEILASDIDMETHVSGPRGAILISTDIKTQGGTIGLKGTIGVADPASPDYDLKLTLDKVSSAKLLSASMNAPPIEIEHIALDVKGKGRALGSIATDAKLHIDGITARGVPIDDVDLDAHVEGNTLTIRSFSLKAVGQEASVSGTVQIPDRHVDLKIALQGDLGEAVARLKAAGLPLTANLPQGLVRLRKGDLTVSVVGDLNGQLKADIDAPHVAFASGSIGIAAHADLLRHDPPQPDGKKIEVQALDAHVTLAGLRLSSLARLKGKELVDLDGTIGGRIDVAGSPTDPHAHLDLVARVQRIDQGGPEFKVALSGSVDKGSAHLKLQGLRGDADLLDGDFVVPLSLATEPKGIDPSRPLAISLTIPKIDFADLVSLVPPALLQGKVIPRGDLALSLALSGPIGRPSGTLDIDVHAHALPDATQRVHLVGKLEPAGNSSQVTTVTNVWLDDNSEPLALANIDATLPRSPLLPGPKTVAWHAAVDVAQKDLRSLPLPNEKIKALGGTVAAHGDFHGDLKDAQGSLELKAEGLKPEGGGPVDATVNVSLEQANATVRANVDLAKSPLLRVDGKVGVAGQGLIAGLIAKRALDPSLDLTIDIPKRPIASLSSVKASLSTAPGDLTGHIQVRGTKSAPELEGGVTVDGFTSLSGEAGRVEVALNADKETLSAKVLVGPGAEAPIVIEAHAPRSGLAELKKLGGFIPVAASVRAHHVDLRRLIPTVALDKVKGLGVQGQLDWNMDFAGRLEVTLLGLKLVEPALSGKLSLDKGQIDLPRTLRTYRDVSINLTATTDTLIIDGIKASESDMEVQNRTFSLDGKIYLNNLKPSRADLHLTANKWLLFGTKAIGLADAPRGTLSIDANASTWFGDIKRVRVDVNKLEVLFRDRFEKAHQPEDVHVGDLVFLGDPSPTGGEPVALGKLPLPASVVEKLEEQKRVQKEAAESAVAGQADGAAAETGLDVEVNIAKGAHLMQAPIDLWPEGTIKIESRKTGRKIRGKLTIDHGELSLGGAFHSLTSGSLSFDDKNPAGYVDFSFSKPARVSALRGISNASAGDAVLIHMFGPISDRRTVLSGSGSPGSLFDLLSVHNVGRERLYTEPDMPISSSVQFPQQEGVLVLSFLSVNLPHLIFLDRVNAWSDPYDAQASYGKLEHYRSERTTQNGKVRVLVEKRPRSAGESEAEVELDYLFANSPQLLFGAGLAGGSRGGGGPGLFMEWSTKE